MQAGQLNLLLLTLCVSRVTPSCDFVIRRSKVANTWQSSGESSAKCFNERTPDEENAVLSSSATSHLFFLSESRAHSDGGFHWFIVQLSEVKTVESVLLRSSQVAAASPEWTKGIEIWTTATKTAFVGDKCKSSVLGATFNSNRGKWKMCGFTKKDDAISLGEIFTVNCEAQVQQLLLRKFVANLTVPNMDVMSFSDLTFHLVEFTISAPSIVGQGSSMTVSCSLVSRSGNCDSSGPRPDPAQLQLCTPDGSCSARQTAVIPSAQPHHAGVYKCKLDSKVLDSSAAVLSLSAEPDYQGTSITLQCSLHCGAKQLCTNSTLLSNLRLCTPSGSCSDQQRMQISNPKGTDNYKCKLDSIESSSAVSEIRKLVASAFVINGDNCKSPSDVTVMFSSTATQPPPEHRCSAMTAGGFVRNLTQKSFSEKTEGFMSTWSFEPHSDWKQGWDSGSVECSSVQRLPAVKELKDSTGWSCSQASTLSPGLIAVIVSVCLIAVIAAAIVLFLIVMKRRKPLEVKEADTAQAAAPSSATPPRTKVQALFGQVSQSMRNTAFGRRGTNTVPAQ